MEKVVIISSHNDYLHQEERRVNVYLDQGWRVKTVHTVTAKEYITAIFVLEKD